MRKELNMAIEKYWLGNRGENGWRINIYFQKVNKEWKICKERLFVQYQSALVIFISFNLWGPMRRLTFFVVSVQCFINILLFSIWKATLFIIFLWLMYWNENLIKSMSYFAYNRVLTMWTIWKFFANKTLFLFLKVSS